MSMLVSDSIARAMVMSCRWPLEMFTPSSESIVLYPSGSRSMYESIRADFAAARTSSIVAFSRP